MPRVTLKIHTFTKAGARRLRCTVYDINDAVNCASIIKQHYRYSALSITYKAVCVLMLDRDSVIDDPMRTEERIGIAVRQVEHDIKAGGNNGRS